MSRTQHQGGPEAAEGRKGAAGRATQPPKHVGARFIAHATQEKPRQRGRPYHTPPKTRRGAFIAPATQERPRSRGRPTKTAMNRAPTCGESGPDGNRARQGGTGKGAAGTTNATALRVNADIHTSPEVAEWIAERCGVAKDRRKRFRPGTASRPHVPDGLPDVPRARNRLRHYSNMLRVAQHNRTLAPQACTRRPAPKLSCPPR